MIVVIVQLLLSGIWLAAATFLATDKSADDPTLRIIAAVVVGLPGAFTFARSIGRLLGDPSEATKERVERSLQAALVKIYRDDCYDDDITRLSFHVWIVPVWYRRLVPYKFRKRVKPDASRVPKLLRPRLRRLAIYRFKHHARSGVTFRKGIGVVGRCIDHNVAGRLMTVALDSNSFRAAIRGGEDAWKQAPLEITQNLGLSDATRLADSYGQVATLVLREASGEAIDCITMDLPPESKVRLARSGNKHQELFNVFHSTAEDVENHLTR
jgi:hypothetical protein